MAVDFSAFDEQVDLGALQKEVQEADDSQFDDVPDGQRFSHAPLFDRPRRCGRRGARRRAARVGAPEPYRLLSQMEGYCNTTGCLREYMLRYFGDEAAAEHAAAAAGGENTARTALYRSSHSVHWRRAVSSAMSAVCWICRMHRSIRLRR